jgi:hypothetical protein
MPPPLLLLLSMLLLLLLIMLLQLSMLLLLPLLLLYFKQSSTSAVHWLAMLYVCQLPPVSSHLSHVIFNCMPFAAISCLQQACC